jgi:hypothetical protein
MLATAAAPSATAEPDMNRRLLIPCSRMLLLLLLLLPPTHDLLVIALTAPKEVG